MHWLTGFLAFVSVINSGETATTESDESKDGDTCFF
jgi:hypothetical protein